MRYGYVRGCGTSSGCRSVVFVLAIAGAGLGRSSPVGGSLRRDQVARRRVSRLAGIEQWRAPATRSCVAGPDGGGGVRQLVARGFLVNATNPKPSCSCWRCCRSSSSRASAVRPVRDLRRHAAVHRSGRDERVYGTGRARAPRTARSPHVRWLNRTFGGLFVAGRGAGDVQARRLTSRAAGASSRRRRFIRAGRIRQRSAQPVGAGCVPHDDAEPRRGIGVDAVVVDEQHAIRTTSRLRGRAGSKRVRLQLPDRCDGKLSWK